MNKLVLVLQLCLIYNTNCLAFSIWDHNNDDPGKPQPSATVLACMKKTDLDAKACEKSAHDHWHTVEPGVKSQCCQQYEQLDCYANVTYDLHNLKCEYEVIEELGQYLDKLTDYYAATQCQKYPYLQKQLCQLTDTPIPDKAYPVNVTVLVEYKCHGSASFISKSLAPVYQELRSILNVDLFPYGAYDWHQWSKVDNHDGTFDLNMTLDEELGSLVMLCVVENEPAERSVPFIGCMYNSTHWEKEPKLATQECADKLGHNITTINECAYGPLGRGLELRSFNRIVNLDKDIHYIPWVYVNGYHTNYIFRAADRNFRKIVCDAYTGTKPAECKE